MPDPRLPEHDPSVVPSTLAEGSLAIVGNAPDAQDRAFAIEAGAFDSVVRFNNAAGFDARTGSRTSLLALVNRGGQMREWLDDPGFLDRPLVDTAEAFLLPFPARPARARGEGDGACWTREALTRLARLGRPVHVLPETIHARARRLLAPHADGPPNPSTGFLVALAILDRRKPGAPPADVYGFGFSGWPGHPWAAERRWFERAGAAGRLRLHPPRARAGT